MTFEQKLYEFNFNLDTLHLFQKDNLEKNQIIEWMESSGFNKDLTLFLLSTNESFFKSIMVRLKYYNKNNKTFEDISRSLSKYSQTLPLVEYLFKTDNQLFIENNKINNLGEETVEVTDSEENCLELFYNNCITKEDGSEIKTKELYTKFTEWYDNNYVNNDEIPKKNDVKKYLINKLGKPTKKGWKNIKVA